MSAEPSPNGQPARRHRRTPRGGEDDIATAQGLEEIKRTDRRERGTKIAEEHRKWMATRRKRAEEPHGTAGPLSDAHDDGRNRSLREAPKHG